MDMDGYLKCNNNQIHGKNDASREFLWRGKRGPVSTQWVNSAVEGEARR